MEDELIEALARKVADWGGPPGMKGRLVEIIWLNCGENFLQVFRRRLEAINAFGAGKGDQLFHHRRA